MQRSRVCYMQDLQVSRHYSRQGESTVLYDLRVLWISYVFFSSSQVMVSSANVLA